MVMEKYKIMSLMEDPRTLVFTKNELKTFHNIFTTEPDEITDKQIDDCYTLTLKLDNLINYLNTKNKRDVGKITFQDRTKMFNVMRMICQLTGDDLELYTGLVTEAIDYNEYQNRLQNR